MVFKKQPVNKRKREITSMVESDFISHTYWPYNGQTYRLKEIFDSTLKNKPFIFLKKLNKQNPNVMFVGPGKGKYISVFNTILKDFNIKKPIIDVLSIKKGKIDCDLIEFNIIKNEYSFNAPLEHINPGEKEHSKIIKKMQGKYDLAMSELSASVHTKYPALNTLYTALLLNKGGKAYVEIRSFLNAYYNNSLNNEYKKIIGLGKKSISSHSDIAKFEQDYFALFKKRFNRILDIYNKNNGLDLKYNLSILNTNSNMSYFLEITRIN